MAWRWRDLSVGLYVPLLEFNQNVSFGRRNEIHHRHSDGRFPAVTFPDQTHCLAGRDNERNIGDGLDMTDCAA